MANPQREDGFTAVANEIVEQLAKINLSAYESRVIWTVLRKTYGWQKSRDFISLTQITNLTGLPKGHCSNTVSRLVKRNILTRDEDRRIGLQKDYEKWLRVYETKLHQQETKLLDDETKLHDDVTKLPNGETEGVTRIGTPVTSIGTPLVPEGVTSIGTTKEIKETINKRNASSGVMNYQDWYSSIKEAKNKPSELVNMLQSLRPDWEPNSNNVYARMGKILKQAFNGDWGFLASKIWDMATRTIHGDLLNYLEKTAPKARDQPSDKPTKRRFTGNDLY